MCAARILPFRWKEGSKENKYRSVQAEFSDERYAPLAFLAA